MKHAQVGGWEHQPYRPQSGTSPKVASHHKYWWQYLHAKFSSGSTKHREAREDGWNKRLEEWVEAVKGWEPRFLHRGVQPTQPHKGIGNA